MPDHQSPELRILNPGNAEVAKLIADSDAFYEGLYPPESNHLDPVDELSQPHVVFLGCYVNDRLVGCGAIKRMRDDGDYAELKRLFIKPEYRQQGLSRLMMAKLENVAREWGINCLRLETGTRQPEALALYSSLGYQQRSPFGSYQLDPLSVFMEKLLATVNSGA